MSALIALLHHLVALLLPACLMAQLVVLRLPHTPTSILLLRRIDACYGLAALSILLIGGLRVAYFEKSWLYYQQHPAFWSKLIIFACIGLLSIYPTLFYQRAAKLSPGDLLSPPYQALARLVCKLLILQFVLLIPLIWSAICLAKGLHPLRFLIPA